MRGHVGGHLDVAALRAPAVRRAQVGQLGLHPVDVTAPLGAVPPLPATDRLVGEVRRVPVAGHLEPAGLGEPLLGEQPDRVVEAVAGPLRVVVGHDQRLADERVEAPEHRDVVVLAGDRAERLQDEATGEHRGRAQDVAFLLVQEVVGPGDHVPEGRLAIRPALGARQQPHPVGEPVTHLGRAHRRHPGRRQLDAQRQTVERLADLDHRRRGLLVMDRVLRRTARPAARTG